MPLLLLAVAPKNGPQVPTCTHSMRIGLARANDGQADSPSPEGQVRRRCSEPIAEHGFVHDLFWLHLISLCYSPLFARKPNHAFLALDQRTVTVTAG